jgi:hypothetical protein
MSDVEIGEITTRIEVVDATPQGQADMRRIMQMMLQFMKEQQHHQAMRDEDGRIRDRSWVSDVKPD